METKAIDILKVITTPSKLLEVLRGCGSFYLSHFESNPIDSKLHFHHRINKCKECSIYSNGFCSSYRKEVLKETFDYYGELRQEGNEYSGCGCNVNCKAFLVQQKCPLGKW